VLNSPNWLFSARADARPERPEELRRRSAGQPTQPNPTQPNPNPTQPNPTPGVDVLVGAGAELVTGGVAPEPSRCCPPRPRAFQRPSRLS
jgi:hypothetical protein